MFKTLGYVVTHIDEKITAQNLLYLHGLAVDDVLDYLDARKKPAALLDGNELIHMRKGYRETILFSPSFYLILPHPKATPGYNNATVAGLHELWALQKKSEQDTSKKPAFKLELLRNQDADGNLVPVPKNDASGDDGVAVNLRTFAGTPQECEALAQEMIDAYHEELALARTSDEKLLAIAGNCTLFLRW